MQKTFCNTSTDGITNLFRLRSKVFVVEVGNHRHGDKDVEDAVQAAAVSAEEPRHLLFVRTFGTGGVSGAEPAGTVIDAGDQTAADHK